MAPRDEEVVAVQMCLAWGIDPWVPVNLELQGSSNLFPALSGEFVESSVVDDTDGVPSPSSVDEEGISPGESSDGSTVIGKCKKRAREDVEEQEIGEDEAPAPKKRRANIPLPPFWTFDPPYVGKFNLMEDPWMNDDGELTMFPTSAYSAVYRPSTEELEKLNMMLPRFQAWEPPVENVFPNLALLYPHLHPEFSPLPAELPVSPGKEHLVLPPIVPSVMTQLAPPEPVEQHSPNPVAPVKRKRGRPRKNVVGTPSSSRAVMD